MTNVSDESCRTNQNHIYVEQNFPENLVVYGVMWDKYGKAGGHGQE
jgi:hypothetical protein